MSRPLVSVVTPSYEQAPYLEEAIRSVLEQDYPSIEYIVVDDGSTDASLEIIRRYADRLAWWTTQANAGQVAALNRGFARARGEILGWLNSDDALLPGAVSTAVEALEADPEVLLVYGDNVFVDEASRTLGSLPARAFDPVRMVRTCENHVPQPGSLFRRRAFEIAPLNEAGYYFFDFEFVLRLSAGGKVTRLPTALASYRVHAASKSVGAPLRKARDYVRLADEFLAGPLLPESLRPYAREGRSAAYLAAGEYFYAALDLRRARKYLLHGIALNPRLLSPRALSLVAKSFLPRPAVRLGRRRRGSPGPHRD